MYDWLVDFGASIFLFLQLWSVAEGSGEGGGGEDGVRSMMKVSSDFRFRNVGRYENGT